MEHARIAPHGGAEAQRGGPIISGKDHNAIKFTLMEIIKGREGGKSSDRLCAKLCEGSRELQHIRVRLTKQQDSGHFGAANDGRMRGPAKAC